jgi:uncharacterized protein DUF2442
MASHDKFDQASERAKEIRASSPYALAARYDRRNNRIVIQLSSKLDVSFDPDNVQGLESAMPSQLEEIDVSPTGLGLHFPALDADIYLPALLEGFLGSRRWMASRLGQAGGRSRTAAKKAASRANGRLGGRPKRKRQAS